MTMAEPRKLHSPASVAEIRRPTPEILISENDDAFLQSLSDFIDHEKRYLQCPKEGPDELRYFIYRSAFNKVFTRS